ncbi:MAG: M23 family metallopeptidase [Pseudomonadaceae bacterium]|nr:M23 family metallopeptidase [Pseudomonadaceae bacterium]
MRIWTAVLVLLAGMVQAAEVYTPVRQVLVPGGFVLGRVAPGAVVTLGGVPVEVAEDGTFVAGFDRKAGGKKWLKVCEGKTCRSQGLSLAEREFKTQVIKGVPAKTVNPDKAQLKRIAADSAAIGAARKQQHRLMGFAQPFMLPVEAPTSGVFGSRRTYNGEERSWHKGHDLAAPKGTPVKAPADAVVVLARDTFMNGNLVILDHGYGLTSLYAHLDSMAVQVGDAVRAGDVLGKVGTTGRSTGPHLHWGMNWGTMAIDPWLWVADNKKRE